MAGHRLPKGFRPQYRGRGNTPHRRAWKAPLVALLAAFFAAAGGIALAATTTTAADPAEVDCTLVVPANPLTATGLATPYQLATPCQQADDGQSAFVQATIIDPATGALFNYDPVVIDQGSTPAAPPVVPKLPAGAVVGIWFGFNGDNLSLADSAGSLTKGNCVNGLGDSIFGQFAFCNATNFFAAANTAIDAGLVTSPDVGEAKDGRRCLSTRDFGLVDQDQSDNVTTSYLVLPDNSTAQNTAANRRALVAKGAKVQSNGSDNGLLDSFVDPALGCAPWTAGDLADPGSQTPSLALNELQAAAHQAAPVALIPTNDPMALVNGDASVRKTNLYRAGVDQAPIDTATETATAYCQQLRDVGVPRIAADKALTVGFTSPDAGAANNLFTFLAARVDASFGELDCAADGVKSPVTVVTDANGIAIDASFATLPAPTPSATRPASPSPTPTGAPSASPSPSPSPTRPASASPSPTRSAPHSAPASPTGTGRPVGRPSMSPAARPTTPAARATTPPPRVTPTARATTAAPPPPPATTTGTTTGNAGGAHAGGGSTGGANSGGDNTGGGAAVPAVSPTASHANGVTGLPVAVVNLSPGPMPLHIAAGHGTTARANIGGVSLAKFAISGVLIVGGLITFGLVLHQLVTRRRRMA